MSVMVISPLCGENEFVSMQINLLISTVSDLIYLIDDI